LALPRYSVPCEKQRARKAAVPLLPQTVRSSLSKKQPEQLLRRRALLMQHMARSIIDSDYVCFRPIADIEVADCRPAEVGHCKSPTGTIIAVQSPAPWPKS
jgi:hypothetical protein